MGQHIRKMEPVPDKVELTDHKAELEKDDQPRAEEPLALFDPRAKEEQNRQEDRKHTAVDVGQALLGRGLDKGDRVGDRLADALQHAAEVGAGADIDGKLRGEGVPGGLRMTQGKVRRNGQHGRHHHTDNRAARHFEDIEAGFFQALEVDDGIAHADKEHKDTAKQADVIVGKDRQRQRQDIQTVLSVPEQGKGPRDHQRQQGNRIQPDDVPVIAHDKGAQRVHDAESGDRDVTALKADAHEQRKEQSAQADLDAGDDIQKLAQRLGRHKDGEEVQRACQIISDQGKIVRAAAGLPCPQQRAAGAQLIVIVDKEGIVLMPQVGDEDLVLAERRYLCYGKGKKHQDKGNKKSQRQIKSRTEPFDPGRLVQRGLILRRGKGDGFFDK